MVKKQSANAGGTRDMSSITGLENPLEEEMVTHSSVLACEMKISLAISINKKCHSHQ